MSDQERTPCGHAPTEYPHTKWIEGLEEEAGKRVLTSAEMLAFVEALLFETVIEQFIPQYVAMIDANAPGGIAHANWTLARNTAIQLASGLGHDIEAIAERTRLVKVVSEIKL